MTRMVTDRQGREWECSVEHGMIVARRSNHLQVYYRDDGVAELPPVDELEELLRRHGFARSITDGEGRQWFVEECERGSSAMGVSDDETAGDPQRRGFCFRTPDGSMAAFWPTDQSLTDVGDE